MRAIVAAAFAVLLVSPAQASDYLTDIPTYDWTGVYGGVHAGFIQANDNIESRPLDLSHDRDFGGFVGGVLGGVNFQAGSIVFGLDMDFGGAVADDESTADIHFGGVAADDEGTTENIHFEHGIDWSAHVRGRLGFAVDRLLVYGAGGLAVADFDVQGNNRLDNGGHLDDGGHTTGWSAGGGLEYALTDNLLVRAEYLHDEYIEEKASVCDVTLVCNNFEVNSTDNIFRVGISWKFMGGMAF